jgi:phosphoribosyl 1,2-cyclic phosphate phosphodiesterase
LKLTFLGTGTSQGVPVIGCKCSGCMSTDPRDKRLRSSVMITDGGMNIVIDTGPDFRQQMLRAETDRLEAVIYTHSHRDHIAGLDDVRAYNFIQHRPMDIFAESDVIHELQAMYSYIFSEPHYPGVPELEVHEISLQPFTIGTVEIIPIRLMHGKLPVLGFRIGDFAYLVDVNGIPSEDIAKLKGVKYLVIGALRSEPHHSHFSINEAIEAAKEIAPEKLYLTHISHQIGPVAELMNKLPVYVIPAYDELVLEV